MSVHSLTPHRPTPMNMPSRRPCWHITSRPPRRRGYFRLPEAYSHLHPFERLVLEHDWLQRSLSIHPSSGKTDYRERLFLRCKQQLARWHGKEEHWWLSQEDRNT